MKLYGLIGRALGHSFSKKYFTEKFRRESINSKYELFEIESIDEFPALIQKHSFSGLNVTIPYKETIIPFLDDIDEVASIIGAVNVVKFIRKDNDLILKGYNSDAAGFTKSISKFLQPEHKKALVLGTGGASKAVGFGLKELGIEVIFVSRKPKTGQLSYSELSREVISNNLIVVNTTPVGMFPFENECPDIPYEFLTTNHLLFDAVYNPTETLFMKKGKERGATVVNGLEMLEEQAIEAWKIWNSN